MKTRKKAIISAIVLLITFCSGPEGAGEPKGIEDYSVIGVHAYKWAHYRDALNAYESGLMLAEKQGNALYQGGFLNGIGSVYFNLGRYEKALSYYEKALAVHRKIRDMKGEGHDLLSIGHVYWNLGQYENAFPYYKKALAKMRKNKDIGGEGHCLANIGSFYKYLDQHEKALEYYEKALAKSREIWDYWNEGDTLNNIGNVYWSLGKYDKSLEYYEKALAINRRPGDLIGEGRTLTNIGGVHRKFGQYEKALEYYEKALAIRRKIGDVQGEGNTLNSMGYAKLAAGKLKPAESHLISAMKGYESIRGLVKSGKERTGFQSTLPNVYGHLAATRLALGKTEEAFEAVERGRAKSFLDLLGTRGGGKGRTGRKTTRIAEMEKRLANLRGKRVKLASAPAGEKTRSARAAVDKKISELDRQKLKLIDELRRKNPELGSLAVVDPPSLKEIQELLGPGTALVEYFHDGENIVAGKKQNQLWVFVVYKGGFHFKAVNVTKKALKTALIRYAKLLADRVSDRASVDSTWARLYGWLIQPIEQHISPKTLIIVPWGPMFKIPFASLAPKGREALGSMKNVVMAPSAGVYRFLVKKRSSGRGRICAIGNPKTAMIPLTDAEKEAKNIAALFKKSVIKIRAQATESLIKGGYEGLGRPDVVHFACHGIFNEKAPELSHLALTPDKKNDGKLEMHEIFNLDWKGVSLVTLSACSSGKGKLGAGDDLVGLTRGFMFAGAPSILCSLWDVDDEATRVLMVDFYRNYLGGMSKPESLRQAQVAMMKNPKWSHPYYWSAFVLFGDWGEEGNLDKGHEGPAKKPARVDAEQNRMAEQKRRLEEAKKKQVASLPTLPSISKQKVIFRDRRFVMYSDGVVNDVQTGLEWVAGPDKDTNWHEANAWVQGLSISGGGWRMPTTEELKTLYDKSKEDSSWMTPLLKTRGWWIWSGETEGSSSAWGFNYLLGGKYRFFSIGSDADRAFAVRSRRQQRVASLPTRPTVSKPDVIGRDGNFEKYANGIVKETRTGIEWVAGPDRDMTWDQAKAWVQSLSIAGGGWRMPTTEELKILYDESKEDSNWMTPLLKTTGWRVWSEETKGSSSARLFHFSYGSGDWLRRDYSYGTRAFAVRYR